ncbi:MAG: metalloregulator ArsR/SmtB family transcription factor [Pseudomonadota bacterium]
MTETMNSVRAAACLAALGKPTRLEIFRRLARSGPNGMTVGGIQEALGIPGSTLAHHLSALTRSGLVLQERQGREVICRPAFPVMDAMLAYLTEECCADLGEQDGDSHVHGGAGNRPTIKAVS